jgi:7-carboxy-7-deazaguanine synthase
MRVSEIFYSVQGEGKLTGVPSVFVRASGCNLRCRWCDTPYASWNPEGPDVTVAQIVADVTKHPARHVVLTGGEPLIMPDIVELSRSLAGLGYHITVETAGTVFQNVACDLMSISPKLADSTPHERDAGRFAAAHERNRLNLPVLRQLISHAPDFQLKFVLSSDSELPEIQRLLSDLSPIKITPADVLLMPEGTDSLTLRSRAAWLTELCKCHGYRYCPRLHIELFGNLRGT